MNAVLRAVTSMGKGDHGCGLVVRRGRPGMQGSIERIECRFELHQRWAMARAVIAQPRMGRPEQRAGVVDPSPDRAAPRARHRLAERMSECREVTGDVAAVDDRAVARVEWTAIGRSIPVVEVAVASLEAVRLLAETRWRPPGAKPGAKDDARQAMGQAARPWAATVTAASAAITIPPAIER